MSQVVGRYAPSPTGALHFGSLLAAVASFCQARAQGGLWRLRIDDLDTPRVVTGADRAIIETLSAFGLAHDGPVIYQSARGAAYANALADLKQRSRAFDCGCTRREAQNGPGGIEGPIYPGTCRDGLPPNRRPRSVRLKVEPGEIGVIDRIQGDCTQDLARDIGDFVIRRADGITSYQLATVIDDAALGVDEVVRGADLLSSTPRQLWIYQCLDLPPPGYAHIPVIVDSDGRKLGKRTGALALDSAKRSAQFVTCLQLLGQQPPIRLSSCPIPSVVRWAADNWSLLAVPRRLSCAFG